MHPGACAGGRAGHLTDRGGRAQDDGGRDEQQPGRAGGWAVCRQDGAGGGQDKDRTAPEGQQEPGRQVRCQQIIVSIILIVCDLVNQRILTHLHNC